MGGGGSHYALSSQIFESKNPARPLFLFLALSQ
jgi:hypothetical protein